MGSLKTCLILGQSQGHQKMSLGRVVVPESKEMLKREKVTEPTWNDIHWMCQSQPGRAASDQNWKIRVTKKK